MGVAAGMIRAFGDWTCANPEGQLSTCLWKLQRALLPNFEILTNVQKSIDGQVKTVNYPALIKKSTPYVLKQPRLMLILSF